MSAALVSLILQFWPHIVAAGAAILGLLKYRSSVIKGERAKRMAEMLASAEDRLEMDREATEAERAAARLSDEEARKEALKWAKR